VQENNIKGGNFVIPFSVFFDYSVKFLTCDIAKLNEAFDQINPCFLIFAIETKSHANQFFTIAGKIKHIRQLETTINIRK